MTNSGSRRTTPLPANWPKIRRMILLRDRHQCQWGIIPDDNATPGQCSILATDVDHMFANDDHRPDNLRALCGKHHRIRTSRQAGLANGEAVRARVALRNRPPERHPGIIQEGDNE